MGPIHPVWALAAIHPRWGNFASSDLCSEEREQRDEAERKRRRAFNEQQKKLEKEEAKRKAEDSSFDFL